MIEFINFSKDFNKTRAVIDLNLVINKGEILGFVGKNGAGKSTTIRALLNLINPSKGKILIDGYDSRKDSLLVKELVSYVPSEPYFYQGVTALDVLTLTCKLCDTQSVSMYKLAEYFELDLKKPIDSLSLGNRKKVSLINAFLRKTPILIFDEPTSGLDPLIQKKFFDLLLNLKEDGKTIFLSSHNLTEIEKYCDRVAIIKDARLVKILDMNVVRKDRKSYLTCTLKDGRIIHQPIEDDINTIISKLSKLDIESLEIKTKTVEEEFMHFYQGGEINE